jgi:hypothetical protein
MKPPEMPELKDMWMLMPVTCGTGLFMPDLMLLSIQLTIKCFAKQQFCWIELLRLILQRCCWNFYTLMVFERAQCRLFRNQCLF